MLFEINYKDFNSDWITVAALDSKQAAELAAEKYWDNSDGGDANDFSLDVMVRESGKNVVEKFNVTAGYSLHFYARSV